MWTLCNEKNREIIPRVPRTTLKILRCSPKNAARRTRNMEGGFRQNPRMTSLFFSLHS